MQNNTKKSIREFVKLFVNRLLTNIGKLLWKYLRSFISKYDKIVNNYFIYLTTGFLDQFCLQNITRFRCFLGKICLGNPW